MSKPEDQRQTTRASPVESSALLACPFCGETPAITKHFKEQMWSLIHRCPVIGAITIDWHDSQREVVGQWNTRAG